MSKRKILSVALTLCMIAILAVGGTLAYFMDTDYDKNVMTLGNVAIKQNEGMRNENGEIVPFASQKIIPATADPAWNDKITVNGVEYDAMNVGNSIDKIVTVTNTGSEPAYIRTIFAFEHTDPNGDNDYTDGIAWKTHVVYNDKDGEYITYAGDTLDNVVINGKLYSIATYVYDAAYAGNDTVTPPSIMQVFFNKNTTNADIEALGTDYEILVLSQAVQSEGFTGTAAEALNEAFGAVSAVKVQEWFGTNNPTAKTTGEANW